MYIYPPTASFEPFPRLPLELRLKIWSFALIDYPAQTFTLKTQRAVKLEPRGPRGVRKHKHHITTIHATSHQPALAHTNQEARLEALQHFSQIPTAMVSNDTAAQHYPPDHQCALVNFSTDVFSLDKIADVPYWTCHSESLKQIQHMRVKVKDLVFFFSDFTESYLSAVVDLREVEFIVAEGQIEMLDELEDDLDSIVAFFDSERERKPNWIFPRVRVVVDGKLLRIHDGGKWTGEV